MTRRIFFLVMGLALALTVGIDLVRSATAALPADRPVVAAAPAACGTPGPWSVASPVPRRSSARWSPATAPTPMRLAAIASSYPGATTQFARYDPVANTWTALAALPSADYDGAAVYANGKVYVFGGTDGATVNSHHPYLRRRQQHLEHRRVRARATRADGRRLLQWQDLYRRRLGQPEHQPAIHPLRL